MRRLEAELVGSRNRFVCMQLASMAREQLGRVAAAAAAGDSQQQAQAARMHWATLEVGGALVVGALFYPRLRSGTAAAGQESAGKGSPAGGGGGAACSPPAGVTACGAAALLEPEAASDPALEPHCYVELMACNQPGRGWGSLLLRQIERFAAAHAAGALAAPEGRPLRSVRLLSVGGAQAFYRRNGYGEPDRRGEMSKPLAAVP